MNNPETQPSPAAVELVDVTKTYRLGDGSDLRAVDDVSLQLRSHEFTAFVGSSGSGKSTLLHLLGSIDQPDSGSICVDGTEITGLSRKHRADFRSRIGFVFQQFHLLPVLTVLDNVLAPLVARKVEFDRRTRARELIDVVGLGGREDALPSQLSGGQQQRVAIARALINDPHLLLADEPTGNLDSHTAEEILTLIRSLRERLGTTVVMATHDHAVARTADRIVTISDGHVADDVVTALAGWTPDTSPQRSVDGS